MRRALLSAGLALLGSFPAAAWADCALQSSRPETGTQFVYALEMGPGNVIDPAFTQTVSAARGSTTTVHHWMEIDENGAPAGEEPALVITTYAGLVPYSETSLSSDRRFRYARDPAEVLAGLSPGESDTIEVSQTLNSMQANRTLRHEGDFRVTFIGCDTSLARPGGRAPALYEVRYARIDPNGREHDTVSRAWVDPDIAWLVRLQPEGGPGFTTLSRVVEP